MFALASKFRAALLIFGGLHLAFGFNRTMVVSMERLINSFRDVTEKGDSCLGMLPMDPFDVGDFELPINDYLHIVSGNASYRSVKGYNLTTWYTYPDSSLEYVRYEPDIFRIKMGILFEHSFVQGRYEGEGKSLAMFKSSEEGKFHISCNNFVLYNGKGTFRIKKSGIRLRDLAFEYVSPYWVTPFFSGLTKYNRLASVMGDNVFDRFSEIFSKEFSANLRAFVNHKLKGVSLDDLAAGKLNSNCTNK